MMEMRLSRLTSLRVRWRSCFDAEMPALILQNAHSLTHLDVAPANDLSDRDAAKLPACPPMPALRSLRLDVPRTLYYFASVLPQLTQLCVMELHYDHLPPMPALRSLTVQRLDDHTLLGWLKSLTSLTHLECAQLSFGSQPLLRSLPALAPAIVSLPITHPNGADALSAELHRCTKLRHLYLHTGLGKSSKVRVIAQCVRSVTLSFPSTFLKMCTALTSLHVTNNADGIAIKTALKAGSVHLLRYLRVASLSLMRVTLTLTELPCLKHLHVDILTSADRTSSLSVRVLCLCVCRLCMYVDSMYVCL